MNLHLLVGVGQGPHFLMVRGEHLMLGTDVSIFVSEVRGGEGWGARAEDLSSNSDSTAQ